MGRKSNEKWDRRAAAIAEQAIQASRKKESVPGRDYALGGGALLAEYLAVRYGISALAWGAALLAWFAIYDFAKHKFPHWKPKRQYSTRIVSALLLIAFTGFITRSPKAENSAHATTSPDTVAKPTNPQLLSLPAPTGASVIENVLIQNGNTGMTVVPGASANVDGSTFSNNETAIENNGDLSVRGSTFDANKTGLKNGPTPQKKRKKR